MKRWIIVFLCLLAVPAIAQQAADAVAPELGQANVGWGETDDPVLADALHNKAIGRPVEAGQWMVTAANPHAVQAGARVLRQGGSAADAMIAVQAVLGLVEPQSSGLGGGAFLVWYDAQSGEMTTLDGRETAPLAATPRLFQDAQGQPMGFFDAVVGGRSVGVPGTPALLQEAHRRWGRSPWPGLFTEALDLSEKGFAVSPRLAGAIRRDQERLARHPATAAYFLPGGVALQAGQLRDNPAYGESLRLLAQQGAAPFYTGEIAADIVAALRGAENPGLLTGIDMALYQVRERAPVCVAYRAHQVCGMGPPSSGGLGVGQILGQLAPYDLAAMGPENPNAWRLIGDSSRLAFADRGRYVADSDYVPVPTKGLLAPSYLKQRSELLRGDDALPQVRPGKPEFDHALNWADDDAIELPSTSHISIVDAAGNALSMTTTIENGFGSRVMARGFLLNNELTDFSFQSHRNGVPVANRVAPGKRPRSSMAPTIVLKDGKPVLVIGSPGGSRIIGYVAQAIIAHLDWGMDVQQAVSMPHLVNRFGAYDIEQNTRATQMQQALTDMGFETKLRDLNSGLHAISIGTVMRGGADPRREGVALGE